MKLPFLIALCLIGGTALAAMPPPFQGGCSPPNVVGSGRDVFWSEPADLNGLIGSSEQILEYGFETEIANDFASGAIAALSHVTYWGGYYNVETPCASGITTPGFNLKFYDDAGCIPGTLLHWVVATNFSEVSVGCQSGAYPMFKWDIEVNLILSGSGLYWFDGQLRDHAFPPMGGRLAAGHVTGCNSVFRSAYYGYPDWTPAIDVFGVSFDASQEFIVIGIPADVQDPRVPAEKASWGSIKSLYR